MNVFESRNPIWSRTYLNKLLTAMQTNPAAALMVTPIVHLIKTPTGNFTPNSLVAAFEAVEADYDDYVATAPPTMVATPLDGEVRGLTGVVQFAVTTDPPVVTNTIGGYWLESTAGVVAYELFPEPEQTPLAVAGDLLVLILKLPLTPYYSLPLTA